MEHYNKIKYIMDNFDFYKVHNVMKFMNWTYYDDKNPPSVERIKETALYCLDLAKDKEKYYGGTGGFYVYKCGDHIELMFCIENWDTEGYEE